MIIPEHTFREVAPDLATAKARGSAFAIHKKRGQEPQAYRVRTEPLEQGGYTVTADKSLISMGRERLASKDTSSPTRNAAGKALLDLNPSYNEDQAAQKYANINQLKGKEVHHLLEIDGTAQYLGSMDAATGRRAAARALADGFRFSDHKNNQTALYGDIKNVPGPRTRAGDKVPPKGHPGKGEHQTDGGVHQRVDNIMSMYSMPNMNNPEEVHRKMQTLTPDQQLGMFAAFTQASRLGVQQQKGIANHAQRKTTLKLEAGLAQAYLPLSPERQSQADAYVQQQLNSRASRRR